jgi:hypothetical protein
MQQQRPATVSSSFHNHRMSSPAFKSVKQNASTSSVMTSGQAKAPLALSSSIKPQNHDDATADGAGAMGATQLKGSIGVNAESRHMMAVATARLLASPSSLGTSKILPH